MCKIAPEHARRLRASGFTIWRNLAQQVTKEGLTTAEHAKRLEEYGPNKLPESTRNPVLVYLSYMWNPLSWAMEVGVVQALMPVAALKNCRYVTCLPRSQAHDVCHRRCVLHWLHCCMLCLCHCCCLSPQHFEGRLCCVADLPQVLTVCYTMPHRWRPFWPSSCWITPTSA
jgi:Cation transporter/ATPase, N-terminus